MSNDDLLRKANQALKQAIEEKKKMRESAERNSIVTSMTDELKAQREALISIVSNDLKSVLNNATAEAQMKRSEEDRRVLIEGVGKELAQIIEPALERIEKSSHVDITPLRDAISKLKLGDIKVPEVKIPALKIPAVKVPKPEVTVNFDASKIKIPDVVVPKMDFPTEMAITGVGRSSPLPVRLMGDDGKPFVFSFPTGGGGGGRIPTDTQGRIKTRQEIVATGSNNTSVSISNTSTVIATENLARESLTISNDSSEVVYIALGGSAATVTGYRLNSNGGAISIGQNTSIPWGGAVHGIVNSDTARTVLTTSF